MCQVLSLQDMCGRFQGGAASPKRIILNRVNTSHKNKIKNKTRYYFFNRVVFGCQVFEDVLSKNEDAVPCTCIPAVRLDLFNIHNVLIFMHFYCVKLLCVTASITLYCNLYHGDEITEGVYYYLNVKRHFLIQQNKTYKCFYKPILITRTIGFDITLTNNEATLKQR